MENKNFRVEIDPDIADLIPQFLENRRGDLSLLGELIATRNRLGIIQMAHKIKGSAAGYGFEELSRLANLIEMAAKEDNFDSTRDLYGEAAHYMKVVEVIYPMD